MAWVRVGDTAGTAPSLMAVMEHPKADARSINEAFGFIVRLATLSGAHFTDYLVDVGTCFMIGGANTVDLLEICVSAGMLEMVEVAGKRKYKIHDDPEFIHLRLKKEVDWERQRRNDNRDNGLIAPARKRDGDQCRYCGVVVHWPGKTSNRKGTMDHVHPGQAATLDTFVVACHRCNSAKQANVDWIEDNPLLDPPKTPLYSRWTAEFLANNGYQVEANLQASDSAAEESSKVKSKREVDPGVNDHDASVGHQVDPGTVSRSASAGPWAKHPGTSGPGASAGPLVAQPAANSLEESSTETTKRPSGSTTNRSRLGSDSVIDSRVSRESSPPNSSFAGSGRDWTSSETSRDGPGRNGSDLDGSGRDGPGIARDRLGKARDSSGLTRRSRKRRR